MASDHQVALTRSHRMPAPSNQISKAARQVVPAFLQKLYEMVNDPNNAELIRWSDAGDSFFVLDHERFAHEVLGRWFKHRNFSSFVRQLNMYGFHKIPHLQQGVLKSDTDTEFWNFAHANFHQGQPDLLCLIQRKKPMALPGEDGAIDLRDPATGVGLLANASTGAGIPNPNAPAGNPALTSGQILDVNSIVSGIAVIKRHQTTISAELNELKRSNQLLWQDALAARAKHQKQQDTINRIVKFLAGVFGHHAAANSPVATGSPSVSGGQHGKEDVDPSLPPGTRRRMRLMIEDAKRDGPRKSMVEELTEMPMDMDSTAYDSSYPTIETPASVPSPSPSVSQSDGISVADASAYYNNLAKSAGENGSSSIDSRVTSATSTTTDPTFLTQHIESQRLSEQAQTHQQPGKHISRAVTPSHHPPQPFEYDPRLNGVLNQLSPSQIQHLLASLASQTISDPNSSDPSGATTINPTATTHTGGLLTSYHQPSSFDFSINPASQPGQSSFNPFMSMPTISPEGLIPFDQYDPGSPTDDRNANTNLANSNLSPHQQQQQQHEETMERQWQAAEDIDKDVNALNTSINSLIQTFGLDPSLLDENLNHGTANNLSHDRDDNMQGTRGTDDPAPSASDYAFFEELFNNMSTSHPNGLNSDMVTDNVGGGGGEGVDYNGMASTAFMDEVPTPSSSDATASPVQPLRQVSPESNLGTANDDPLSTGLNLASNDNRKKRKSEVIVDFEGPDVAGTDSQVSPTKVSAAPTTKSKRRKEK